MTLSRLWRWLALIILMGAWAAYVHRLGAQSFWNDEGNSARLSERSLRLILEGTASDVHPPLYYLILRGWRELAGASEFSLRAISAFSGLLLTALTLRLGRRLGDTSALVAGLGVAVNPALVYYAQEARMYMLLALLSLAATALWQVWLTRRTWGWGAAYAICLAAGLYTHYFFPVVVALHAAWLLLNRRGRVAIWPWVGWVGLAGLLYAPWLPVALGPLGGNRGAPQPAAAFVAGLGRFALVGPTLALEPGWVVWLVWLGAGLVLAWRRPAATYLALGIAGPVVALVAVRATDAAFYKFALMIIPWGWLLMAAAGGALVQATPRTWARRWLLVGLLSGGLWWAGLTARSLGNLYTNPTYARADYRGMARRIAAEGFADAAVILDAPNQWEVFTYYYGQAGSVAPLPLAGMDAGQVSAELAQLAAAHTHLYVLFWGDRQQDPQALVENWLNAHTFKVREEWVGDVHFALYAAPGPPAVTMQTATDALFGDAIRLQGYSLSADHLRPGDVLTLTLFWQAIAPLDQRYKVFVHLSDSDGRPLAQRDSEPQGGLAPTTIWMPNATVVDNYGLLTPLDLPAGVYTLRLGLYAIDDPTRRLPVVTANGSQDSFVLRAITIR